MLLVLICVFVYLYVCYIHLFLLLHLFYGVECYSLNKDNTEDCQINSKLFSPNVGIFF